MLAGFDQSRVKSAQADVDAARTRKTNLETQKAKKIKEFDEKIAAADADVATAKANADAIDPSGKSRSRAAVDARAAVVKAETDRAKLVSSKTAAENKFNSQIADADNAIKAARSARLKTNKDFKA